MEILVSAIRKCYDSGLKSDSGYIRSEHDEDQWVYELGQKDKGLIESVIKNGHTSTLEHVTFNFDLSGYSRALLQEKSRHRMASVSEKSTRYCLGKMKTEKSFFIAPGVIDHDLAKKYVVYTGIDQVDDASVYALEALRLCIVAGVPNDKAKFCLPDSLMSECIFSINARSLRNWFELRTGPRALWEIRDLAFAMYDAIPVDYQFIFSDCISPK
jgi:thymidylate synthase (FAD)